MSSLEELKAFCGSIGCECTENEPMSGHTTFKIGGPADLLIRPANSHAAAQIMRAARGSVQLSIMGKGSNLLVSDEGVRGAVVSLDERTAKPTVREDGVIDCPAGASLTALCNFALANALTGLEFAYGIPGSVGGAVYMNAGAYGGELKNVLDCADFLDEAGNSVSLKTEELEFGYRKSVFTTRSGCLITGASFRLQRGDPAEIRAKMNELMERRISKQPLEFPSAGSTFKRPEGAFASALIDQCGLKGRRIGGAMVSEKHAGFLINVGNATCRDVLALIDEIRRVVYEQTGYDLEPEIRML